MRKNSILDQLLTLVPARVRGDRGRGSNRGLICVYLIKRVHMEDWLVHNSILARKGGVSTARATFNFIMDNAVDDPSDEVVLVKFTAHRAPNKPNEVQSYSAPLHVLSLAYVVAEDNVPNVQSNITSAANKFGINTREDLLAEAEHLPTIHLEFPEFVDYDPTVHGASLV